MHDESDDDDDDDDDWGGAHAIGDGQVVVLAWLPRQLETGERK